MPRSYLSRTQRRVAMQIARGSRPREIMQEYHLSRATLYRWRRRPDFRALVQACLAPVPGTGFPGWLVMAIQESAEPVLYCLSDMLRHGSEKALAVTLQALTRAPFVDGVAAASSLPYPSPLPQTGRTGTAAPIGDGSPQTGGCTGFTRSAGAGE